MNIKEKRKLLIRYPSLRYFFIKETKKTYVLRKYTRCWFLENSGSCCIQKKYGYSFKPFICRLHPFYVVGCRDERIIVIKHCPMLYVDRENKNKKISRKQILENAQEAISNNHIIYKINWPEKRLNLERRILEDSRMFLSHSNYLDFSAHQLSITRNSDIEKIKLELLELIAIWKDFLELHDLNLESKRLTYELTAITPLLRVSIPQLRAIEAKEIPLALLALYFYILIYTKTRAKKIYFETYRQALGDIVLGLLQLKKDDLKIKYALLEDKINYLRQLQTIHMYRLKTHCKKIN